MEVVLNIRKENKNSPFNKCYVQINIVLENCLSLWSPTHVLLEILPTTSNWFHFPWHVDRLAWTLAVPGHCTCTYEQTSQVSPTPYTHEPMSPSMCVPAICMYTRAHVNLNPLVARKVNAITMVFLCGEYLTH